MKKHLEKLKTAQSQWPRWIKITLRVFGILLLLQILFCVGVVWYVNTHKPAILAMVTEKLNENLNGKLTIESMEPTFFESFPRISLHLKNVAIRDTMFQQHHKTLLEAADFDVAVNAVAFIRGSVEIKKISISNASVNLFTDANGYSNSAVFKSKAKKGSDSAAYPELRKFELDHVNFTIDNQQKHKLFQFDVEKINGKMSFDDGNWKADFSLNALVKSLAFSTQKGSFIKDKVVQGDFDIIYNSEQEAISILENKLDIGGEKFKIAAEFITTAANTTDYAIHITNDEILWHNASHLLTPNIYKRLDRFNLTEPIAVRCDISGNFGEIGDPFILVIAKIKENELSTPGVLITNCTFTGIFTNNNIKEQGFNDVNSAVKFENFTGSYSGLPFAIKSAAILNFEKPIAKGNVTSKFNLQQLQQLIDPHLLKFTNGTANMNLNFEADIENYMLSKPIVTGIVAVKDGNVEYAPRKLHFTKTSVVLNFKNDDLFISDIHLQTGKSAVNMEGEIRNFLNLYYTAPEKVVLNWRIKSPEIHLAEFIDFLGKRKGTESITKKKKPGDFTENVNDFFENSKVSVALRVSKLYYNDFLASDVKADLFLTNSGISVKDGALNNSGGTIKFDGFLAENGKINNYKINANVTHVDVSKFFYAFDNFGLQSMDSKNLNGLLSAQSQITGKITDKGGLVANSMLGNVDFQLNKGALLNFDPIRRIGKYAFPLRDMNNIVFQDLNGKFSIRGEQVAISPMQVNSSVLNMDMEGTYSFGKGTNINVSVPLRNPEKDKDITDADVLAERRERGVVIRLQAADGDDGKVKLKLVSKKAQQKNKSED